MSDRVRAARAAHSLKSTSARFGAPRVTDRAAAIERLAARVSEDELMQLVSELAGEYQASVGVLRNALVSPEAGPALEPNRLPG